MSPSDSPPATPAAAVGLPVGHAVEPGAAGLPARKALTGRFVSLLPIDADACAASLYACSHGSTEAESLWTYMPYGPFADAAVMRAWLADRAVAKEPVFFAVIDNISRNAVGMISYLNIVPTHRTIEIGNIWYAPAAQRTKTNTEAVYLLLHEAFEQLRYRRVEWKCDSLNARSRGAALRLGFAFEGIFRQHMIIKGRNRDSAWYAMLDRDWPAIRNNYIRWLYGTSGEAVSLAALNRPFVQASLGEFT